MAISLVAGLLHAWAAGVVAAEATLTFLGVGLQAPAISELALARGVSVVS